MITVYGLTDEHGQIRYVGQSCHVDERFKHHQRSQQHFTVSGCAILERVASEVLACRAEHKWIAFFGRENLMNGSNGQQSMKRRCSTETSVTVRITAVERGKLAKAAGPHGSLSSVLRMLIDRFTYAEKILKVRR